MKELLDPRAAAERALCLAAVSARACMVEKVACVRDTASGISPRVEHLHAWLRRECLWERLSAWETVLLEKAIGQWSEQERVDASWQIEAAGCIVWALRHMDMPPYDTHVVAGHIMDVLPRQGDRTHEWITEAMLRDEHEIRQQREIAEIWLWRFRKEMVLRNPHLPFSDGAFQQRIRQVIVKAALRCQNEGWFQAIEEDFPAFGRPYAQASDTATSEMGSIATLRLHTLNWLCGQGSDWDSITCDT